MAGVFYAIKKHFWGLCARAVEYAHKPLAGLIIGLPKVPV